MVEKAEFIDDCLGILAARQSVSYEEYVERVEIKDVVERRFEMMTQACIDIARILLGEMDVEVPEASAESMHRLASLGVLSEKTAERMDEACGLRNVLAHQYDTDVEDVTVYESLRDLTRYREFLVEVYEFLSEIEAI